MWHFSSCHGFLGPSMSAVSAAMLLAASGSADGLTWSPSSLSAQNCGTSPTWAVAEQPHAHIPDPIVWLPLILLCSAPAWPLVDCWSLVLQRSPVPTVLIWLHLVQHRLPLISSMPFAEGEPAHLGAGVGHIDKDMLKEHMPPPQDGSLVLVCGPPPMYKAISGDQHTLVWLAPPSASRSPEACCVAVLNAVARQVLCSSACGSCAMQCAGEKASKTDQGEVTGALGELGYKPEHVYKF